MGFGIEGFGPEDLRIVIRDGNIAIAGGEPRGTLYGVYTFLEDCLDVRFLTADHTHIPPVGGWKVVGPIESAGGSWEFEDQKRGLSVHGSAGFGDAGFCGFWTLEMFAVQPVRIYPGVGICQIFYHRLDGAYRPYASDKYQHNRDIQPSMLFKELNPDAAWPDPQLKLPFEEQHGG